MKRTFAVILVLVGVVGVLVFVRSIDKVKNDPTATPPIPGIAAGSTTTIKLDYLGNSYNVYWDGPYMGEDISLIPNYSERLTVNKIKSDNACELTTSAGFYTKESTPIAYILVEGKEIKGEVQNSLFNGFFTINLMRTPRITRDLPHDSIWYGLQVGPLLIVNDAVQNLSIRNDEYARRVVAGVTGENRVYFFVITRNDKSFDGPKLAELPGLLSLLEKNSQINLADAINLDGGSASAFISKNATFTELTSVGSVFCAKKNPSAN